MKRVCTNHWLQKKIEYHSTIDVAALKNEIVQCDNEYQMKIELGREIKKIVQELNVPIASLDKEMMDALELFEDHGKLKKLNMVNGDHGSRLFVNICMHE